MKNAELVRLGEVGGKLPASARDRHDRLLDEATNSKYVQNSIAIADLPSIDTDSAAEVKQRIDEYFTLTASNAVRPSYAGLALALGVDRLKLKKWLSGAVKKPADVVRVLERAVGILNVQMEDYMQNGNINPVSGIFMMKNNLNYVDTAEVVVTPNNPFGDVDKAALEKKYLESIPEAEVIETN